MTWPTEWYCSRGTSRLLHLNSDLLCASRAKSRTFAVCSSLLFSLYRKQRKLPSWGQKQTTSCSSAVSPPSSVQQLRTATLCSANAPTFSLAHLLFLSFISSMHRLLIFFCVPSADSWSEMNRKSLSVTPSHALLFTRPSKSVSPPATALISTRPREGRQQGPLCL